MNDIGRAVRALACLLVLLASLAAAQERRAAACPLDGEALALPAPHPWNTGGGIDSDGCAWTIDGAGERRVVGLDVVVECPRCGLALREEDAAGLRLGPDDAGAVRAALVQLGPARRDGRDDEGEAVRRRLERAAALLAAVPALGRPGEDREAAAGELWLRAAWAARQRALAGEDGGYRPRGLAEAKATLEVLEWRVERGVDRDPALALLGAARADLDAAGGDLSSASSDLQPGGRLRLARARAALGELARRLGELEALLRPGGAADLGLELALARGWSRHGTPARRERWLELARSRYGDAVAAAVAALRAGCAEEDRLLGLAGDALAASAARVEGEARARRLLLAGDAARRRRDGPVARARLEAARALGGEAGAQAQALLEGLD